MPSVAAGIAPAQHPIVPKTTANDAVPVSIFSPAITGTKDIFQPKATDEKSTTPATNQLATFTFVSCHLFCG